MINAREIKMAEDIAKKAQQLSNSLPSIMARFEKHLTEDEIKIIREAKSVSNFDGVLKDLGKAQKDYNLFMKQYASQIK